MSDYEPDYESIMADREEERGERKMARLDRQHGRVEDYRPRCSMGCGRPSDPINGAVTLGESGGNTCRPCAVVTLDAYRAQLAATIAQLEKEFKAS